MNLEQYERELKLPNIIVSFEFDVKIAILGWHSLSNATCLRRPRSLYACFVASRIIICYIILNHHISAADKLPNIFGAGVGVPRAAYIQTV